MFRCFFFCRRASDTWKIRRSLFGSGISTCSSDAGYRFSKTRTLDVTRRFVEFWSLDMNSYLEPWILKFVLLKFFEHGNLVVVLSIIVKIL
ncbi:hypothetical protein RCL_jg27832.t4 [Rhizophagus clarus]|uniref:Uncharacterized protein n=1 Tax=Rhizophagus clarus TaxID=94130 RepID=A0A8H3LC21_9GLOM|nr:hypothetical protein RCL_jg27832.t4 [Rhizophagus clarus]